MLASPALADEAANACKVSELLPPLQALVHERIPETERSYQTLMAVRLWDEAERVMVQYDASLASPAEVSNPLGLFRDRNALKRFRLMRDYSEGRASLAEFATFLRETREDFYGIGDVLHLRDLSDEALEAVGQILAESDDARARGANMATGLLIYGKRFVRFFDQQDVLAWQSKYFIRWQKVNMLARAGEVNSVIALSDEVAAELDERTKRLSEADYRALKDIGVQTANGRLIAALDRIGFDPALPDPNLEGLDFDPPTQSPAVGWRNRAQATREALNALTWDQRRTLTDALAFEQLRTGNKTSRLDLAHRLAQVPEQGRNIGKLFAFVDDDEAFLRVVHGLPQAERNTALEHYILFVYRDWRSVPAQVWQQLLQEVAVLEYQTYQKSLCAGDSCTVQVRPNAFEDHLQEAANLVLAFCQ